MSRVKQWIAEGVAAVAVCCLFLSCLAAGEQTSFGDLGIIGIPVPATCANSPACKLKGEEGSQVCGTRTIRNERGGRCDDNQIAWSVF